MGCPIRATMDVVQVGEALGLPVWLDTYASQADWIGLVNRVKPHTDFKGSIESGLFKMMTIGLGKYQGAIQYHRANIHHGYEKVITSVGREMLAKARIGFGVGIVEKSDTKPTPINCITAGTPNGAKIPATYDTDREAIETALSCIGLTPPEKARVIRIKNTLMLGEIEVSEAYLPDVARRSDLTSLGDPAPLAFDVAGRLRAV